MKTVRRDRGIRKRLRGRRRSVSDSPEACAMERERLFQRGVWRRAVGLLEPEEDDPVSAVVAAYACSRWPRAVLRFMRAGEKLGQKTQRLRAGGVFLDVFESKRWGTVLRVRIEGVKRFYCVHML